MKRFFAFVLAILASATFVTPIVASAACNPFFVVQGGTGNCGLNTGFIPFGGATATTKMATSSGLFFTAALNRLTFTNGSSTLETIATNLWLPSIATPAGTLLAVDTNGKVIATSTPSSVTSITAGTGLNGGVITTAGTLSLKSYFSTTTADTANQVMFFTSTGATPATFGGNAAFTFTTTGPTLLTSTNASTTNLTAATSLQIPTSASQAPTANGYIAHDQTNNQIVYGKGGTTGVLDERRAITFALATTTAWTGTTTVGYQVVFPYGSTITGGYCTVLPAAATVNAQLVYANPTAYTTVNVPMIPASTTPGLWAIASNNTPAAAATSTLQFGTPASSPTSASCTYLYTVTAT